MKNTLSILFLLSLFYSAFLPISLAQTVYLTEENSKLFGSDKETVCERFSSVKDRLYFQGERYESLALKKRLKEDAAFAKKLMHDVYGFQKAIMEVRQYTPELLTDQEVTLVNKIVESFEQFISEFHPALKIDEATHSNIKPLWGDEKDDLRKYFQAKDNDKQELYKITKLRLLGSIIEWADVSEVLHCKLMYGYKFSVTYDENNGYNPVDDNLPQKYVSSAGWQGELSMINSNFAAIFAMHNQLGEDFITKEELDIMTHATDIKLTALRTRFPEITDEVVQKNYIEELSFLPDFKNSKTRSLASRRRGAETSIYATIVSVEIRLKQNVADIELYPLNEY